MAQQRGGGPARSHLDTTRYYHGLSSQVHSATGRPGRVETIRSYASTPNLPELYEGGPGDISPPASPSMSLGPTSADLSEAVESEGAGGTSISPSTDPDSLEAALLDSPNFSNPMSSIERGAALNLALSALSGANSAQALQSALTAVDPVAFARALDIALAQGMNVSEALAQINAIAEDMGLDMGQGGFGQSMAMTADQMGDLGITNVDLAQAMSMDEGLMDEGGLPVTPQSEQTALNNQALVEMLDVVTDMNNAPTSVSGNLIGTLSDIIGDILGLTSEPEGDLSSAQGNFGDVAPTMGTTAAPTMAPTAADLAAAAQTEVGPQSISGLDASLIGANAAMEAMEATPSSSDLEAAINLDASLIEGNEATGAMEAASGGTGTAGQMGEQGNAGLALGPAGSGHTMQATPEIPSMQDTEASGGTPGGNVANASNIGNTSGSAPTGHTGDPEGGDGGPGAK